MRSRWHRRGAWVLVALLTLAGCTYPEPPRGAIDLTVEDDVVTALLDHGDIGAVLYESHDRGLTWTLVAEADHWNQFSDHEIERETSACTAEDRCYRIDDASETAVWEMSATGGESPAWSFPPGRLDFLERYDLGGSFRAYNPSPRDIVVVGEVVLVAMGNDGVLRGTVDGQWQRGALGDPRPFSEWGANLYMEIVVLVTAVGLVMAVVMLSTFTTWARREGARLWRSLGPWTVLGYMTTVPALLLALLLGALGISAGTVVLFMLPTFWAAIATWLVMFPGSGDRGGGWPLILLLGIPIGGLFAFGVLYLWSGGVIPWYPVAAALALVLAGGGTALAVVAAVRIRPSDRLSQIAQQGSGPEPVSAGSGTIPWVGASIVAAGTAFGALVFLLPFHVGIEEGPNGPLTRLLLAVLGMGVALTVAGLRFRPHQGVRYALAGLGASLLAGPGIGTMMVLPPTPPARTLLRIVTYMLFWILGVGAMFTVRGVVPVPGALTFTFGALLSVSPFCVPVADLWAMRRGHRQVAATS